MGVEIRLARAEDAAEIAEIYRPIIESTATSFEFEPPDAREMQKRIADTIPAYPWLVCTEEGRVAGYAYGSRHNTRAAYNWSANASVYIHSDYRRRGIGKGLYTSLFEILAAQGCYNVYAGITLPNAGSMGLHEAMGFRPVGVYRNVGHKFGAWHDVAWWQRPLRTLVDAPGMTRGLDELQGDPSWPALLAAGLGSLRE